MTFNDALDAVVSREEARREIERHQCPFAAFLAEVGDKPTYRGSEVLFWLGY